MFYRFKDINNDGLIDFTKNRLFDGRLHTYINKDNNLFSTKTIILESVIPYGYFIVADIEMDNNMSIIFSTESGCFFRIYDFENPANMQTEQITNSIVYNNHNHWLDGGFDYEETYSSEIFHLADVNNDNILDFLYYHNYDFIDWSAEDVSSNICLQYSLGDYSSPLIYNDFRICSSVHYDYSYTFGRLQTKESTGIMDFDFDGSPEVYKTIRNQSGSISTYWYNLDFDNLDDTVSDLIESSPFSTGKLTSGNFIDLDADTDNDFVFMRNDSLFWIENAPGNNLNSDSHLLFTSVPYSEDITAYGLSDLNSDGLTDLFFKDATYHKIFAATKRSTGEFNDIILLHEDENSTIRGVTAEDIDDDGDNDIIIYYAGHIEILENQGYMLFRNMQIDEYNNPVVKVVDLDFDGDSDFLYFDRTRRKLYWRENYTQVPNSETSAPSFNANITNYPNPFNPSTNISFNIKEDTDVEITIYNLKGQRVKSLVDRKFEQGQHKVEWNGTDSASKSVGSGVYFYKVDYNGKTQAVKKCVMMK